jgi:hypothetical protein
MTCQFKLTSQKTSKIMKILKAITASFLVSFGVQLSVYSQTYTLSESVDNLEPAVFANSQNIGSLSWGSGTLSDTVVINPSAYTIDQSGSIYLPAEVSSVSLMETQSVTYTVQNPFPNPPTTVTSDIIGNLTVTVDFSGGNFSFDSGTQSLQWNGSSYSFGGGTAITLPISISYSLVTGGQTYSGMDNNVDTTYFLTLGDELDTTEYPVSISISPDAVLTPAGIGYRTTIANFTASNGFQADIVATVPEPGTTAIFALGLVGLALGFRWYSGKPNSYTVAINRYGVGQGLILHFQIP